MGILLYTQSDLYSAYAVPLRNKIMVAATVAPPSITLGSPNGREIWPVNSTQKIQWQTENLATTETISLYLAPNNNLSAAVVLAQNLSKNGLYRYTVQDPSIYGFVDTDFFKVKVCINSCSTAEDWSDKPFMIRGIVPSTLTVIKAGTGTGSVTSNPTGIACGVTCTFTYNGGESITLTAIPYAGSILTGWSGDCVGTTSPVTITMDADKSCTATFDLIFSGAFAKPRGIYVLDSKGGTLINGVSLRDNNIRDYSFVSGYTWRQVWSTFETSEGVYDFSLIDAIIAKLIEKGGKKLTLLIGNAASEEPAYIAAHTGVTTRDVVDTKTGLTTQRAVPWDPYLQERLVAFTEALANHPVLDANGTLIPLRDHPILDQVDLGLAGLGRIRKEDGIAISSLPGYTRQNLIDAVLFNLHAATDNFPKKFTSIGLWNVTDETTDPALWDDIRLAILGEFDGVKNPRVGFFQENLAASIDPDTGELIGTPSTEFAAPLYLSKDQTFIVFQALETWGASDKTANTTPSDGINYGYTTYGSLYYELYVNDVDDPTMASSYQTWQDTFTK